MAVVKFGPLVQSVRGALGSLVFARQGGAAIVRPRPLKVNQRSTGQLETRANYERCVNAWRGLTDQQRLMWFRCAQSYRHSGPDGVTRPLTAWQTFALVNLRALDAGLATQPVPFGFGGYVEAVFVRLEVWPSGPVRLVHSAPSPVILWGPTFYDLSVQRIWRTWPTLPAKMLLRCWHALSLCSADTITSSFPGAPAIGEYVRWSCISHLQAWPMSSRFAGLSQVPNVSVELLTNGDMEIGAIGALPTGWTYAGTGSFVVTGTEPYGDLKSALWFRVAGAGSERVNSPGGIDISVAGTYHLRMAARCTSSTAWEHIWMIWDSGGNQTITLLCPPADDVWHELDYSFVVPAGKTTGNIRFGKDLGTATEVRVDNVSVRRDL
jgi:hypothetical protein